MPGGRPKGATKFKSVKALESAIDQYFKDCDSQIEKVFDKNKGKVVEISSPEPYTIEGLALALDIDLETLRNYEKKEGYERFFGTVKKAKLKVQRNKVVNMLRGKGSAAGYIFDLKNNHGYVDKQEVDSTQRVQILDWQDE